MSNILIFRGRSATGKTILTDRLGKELGYSIIRKDDIYDIMVGRGIRHGDINKIAYDIMAKMIQTNINSCNSIIVDLALAHKPYIEMFLSKINWENASRHSFFCTCRDRNEWERRLECRFKNPLPNQISIFGNIEEAYKAYENCDMALLDDELELDSSQDIALLQKLVVDKLKKEQ